MDLPKNARVAVVDNEPKEVKDLLAVLAKKGIGALYYVGPSAFPADPLTGIRLLFLDLELEGLQSSSPTTKASTAVGVLKKLVSPDNGPLVVVIWTDHQEDAAQVKAALQQAVKMPLFVACIAKSDCETVDETGERRFSLDLIQTQLDAQLSSAEIDVFGLYVDWENAVFKGTVQLAARLSSVADDNGEKWHEIMSRAFHKLYKTECDKNDLVGAKEQFLCACHLYNDGLVSSVNNALSKMQLGVSEEFKFKEEKLSDEIENALRNRLNAFLFYDRISHAFVAPGDVFAVRGGAGADANLLKAILRDFGANCELLDSISQSENIKLCKVIVTPLCDVAQNKKLTVPNVCKFDRYAWAVLACGDMRSGFKNPKTDYAYNVLKGFEYDGVVYDLLIDLCAIGTEVVDIESMDWLFTLKPAILADVQSKAANQLNRIGICAVK